MHDYGQWLTIAAPRLAPCIAVQGLHIITPNKKLGSGPLERYNTVRRMQRESYIHFFYEVWPGH